MARFLSLLLATLRGALTLSLLTLNVIFWFVPIILLALAKLAVPLAGWRNLCRRWLTALGENWVSSNQAIFTLTGALTLELHLEGRLQRDASYLMLANHQSWVDVLVLQAAFNRRVPFLKFFIKERLKWVPFLGLAWWAMDMPFVKRHSRAYLQRHPEARTQDLEATRRACERFRRIPTTVISFVEGTRYSDDKRRASDSPYRHLLAPKAGGIAFTLSAMGDALHSMLDVTIAYAERSPTLWDLCCGRLQRVAVHIRQRSIESWMTSGDYANDADFRNRIQELLAGIWRDKDHVLADLLPRSEAATLPA